LKKNFSDELANIVKWNSGFLSIGNAMSNDSPDFATLAIEQMQDPKTCLRIALQDPCGDPRRALEAMIATIDRTLSNQIWQILHHPDFQQLEGAWRGLHHLVARTETDEMLKIKCLNLSKAELREMLEAHQESRSRNPLFVQLHDEAYRQPSGEPFGCLVGDYYFDHSPQDVAMLRELADICEFIHAPFLAGGAPSIIGAKSWREGLGRVEDHSKSRFSTEEYGPWLSLRNAENARFLYLVIPRFLARPLYGNATQPVAEFDFQEEDEGICADHHAFTWFNAAYVMAMVINRAFKQHGWCAQIRGRESGGLIENLPTHIFPNDCGGVNKQCYTEIAINERRECEIANRMGLISPIQNQNSDKCFFVGVQSLRQMREYADPNDTANYALSGRLPYLLVACRFAQYLQCIVRDHIDAYRDRRHMQNHLQTWLQQYVCGDLTDDTDEKLARRPLAEARIVVEEIEGNSMHYIAKFIVRPIHQIYLTAPIKLELQLPTVK
jgi:type VI secretion system protein ImpC